MGHAETTDEQLVGDYNAGEAGALETLARRHYEGVYRNALYRTRDPEVARDVAQEVFLRVTRALPRFRGEAQFKTWLHCITVRVCIDHIRAVRSQPQLAPLDAPFDSAGATAPTLVASGAAPDEQVTYGELTQRLDAIVEDLPDRQRRVFKMRHYDHMKLADIAGALDRSLGTVKAQLFTARATLRESLDPYLASSVR
ncbi:MAG: sigma-70 family RNA polymerase sigma factor [Candidatus Poribacteria bacterium]